MKKKMLAVGIGFLLIGMNGFAADGDLVVNGRLSIGTPDPSDSVLRVYRSTSDRYASIMDNLNSSGYGLLVRAGGGGYATIWAQDSSGNTRWYITGAGDMYAPYLANNVGNYYLRWTGGAGRMTYTSSDSRQKFKLRPLEYGLKEILELEPKRYEYRGGRADEKGIHLDATGVETFGLVAQEVWKVMPDAVYKPEDESKAFWNVDFEKITFVMVNAIKEQQARIEALKALVCKDHPEAEACK